MVRCYILPVEGLWQPEARALVFESLPRRLRGCSGDLVSRLVLGLPVLVMGAYRDTNWTYEVN